MASTSRASGGFTLVEILIVVVILGVLAAVVVPRFAGASDQSRRAAFITNVTTFAEALEMHYARTGQLVADSGTGTLPPELAGVIRVSDWENGTPIGGEWDVETNENGISNGVGVDFDLDHPGDAYMQEVDALFDDGNLATGKFRQLDDVTRFYYVVVP